MIAALMWNAALCLLTAVTAGEAPAADGQAGPWIRINQVGYLPGDTKVAILSGNKPLTGRFTISAYSADIGPDQGAWGPFKHNYRLDFTTLRTPGAYRLQCGDAVSPPVRIGDHVYDAVSPKLLDFMRLQRCGDNPVTGRKCHQSDAIDSTTGERVDAVGGWHDAADRIKHVITTSWCVAALYLADAKDEARYGADFLRKMHPAGDRLYVQIADDRDHGPPEALWHDDRTDYGWGAGGPRPAWRATGKPEGPTHRNKSSGLANLAGRMAAAMALAGDVREAETLYRLAAANPGCAMSVPVKAPYYYGEASFHDDLEWAAIELYIATREPHYLAAAIEHAEHAGDNAWMGRDRHGHYEFFPYVNVAHWRLSPHVDDATRAKLAGYYRAGLERIGERALKNPYRLGTPLVWCSTNNVIAFATQAVLYERMTGDSRYRPLATEARDWIFGRNPWGVSFVIGVPADGVFASRPHHLMHRLAGVLPVGGLVDGPVHKDINDGLKFADFGADPLAAFQSDVGVYHDAYHDFSTNEPIIDGTVSLLWLLKIWR
jgi:hypothetical protein